MEWKYKDITEKIIGAAMKVHSTLGNGFPEIIYQKALTLQLHNDAVEFIRECSMPVYYLNEKIGERRVDFLVEQKICVELKAISELDATHFAQAKNYLEAFNLEIALLINFGSVSLQYRRLSNSKYNPVIQNPNNL